MIRVRLITALAGCALLFGAACGGSPAGSPSSTSPTSVRPTATASPGGPSSAAAVRCPAGSTPDVAGPTGQARPAALRASDLIYVPAVMDTRTGQLLLWDPTTRSTWAFDVCTNTWRDLKSVGGPTDDVRTMVYSEGHDAVIALVRTPAGALAVWTYQPTVNRWSMQPLALVSPTGFWQPNAAYDSLTGDVYVRDAATGALWYYALALNRWTVVSQFGELPPSAAIRPSAGMCTWLVYDVAADRLVLVLGIDDPADRTWTFDPGSRIWTRIAVDAPRLASGYGDSGAEAAYDVAHARTLVHTFNTTATLSAGSWKVLARDATPSAGATTREFHTLAYDPLNRRVLMLGGSAFMSGTWPRLDDLWAFDVGTSHWLRLVAPSR